MLSHGFDRAVSDHAHDDILRKLYDISLQLLISSLKRASFTYILIQLSKAIKKALSIDSTVIKAIQVCFRNCTVMNKLNVRLMQYFTLTLNVIKTKIVRVKKWITKSREIKAFVGKKKKKISELNNQRLVREISIWAMMKKKLVQ